MSTRTKLWWIFGGAWAILLLVLGVWSAMNSPATVRDQTTIGAGKEKIESVVGELRATLPPAALFQDGGYHESTCRITPMRDGTSATRTISVTGLNGTEAQTLRTITAHFKGSSLQPGEGIPTGFFYDAGEFVLVRGEITDPGTLLVELKTGCRAND